MTRETMTLRKALAEKKLLDSRIQKLSRDMTFLTPYYEEDPHVNGIIPIGDVEEDIKSKSQQLIDLIKRREAINKAIMETNMTNKVEVPVFAGFGVMVTDETEEISLALAINRKSYYQNILSGIQRTFSSTLRDEERRIEAAKEKNEQNIKNQLDRRFQDKNASQDVYTKIKEQLEASAKIIVSDPLDAKKLISNMETMIEDYLFNIDNLLSNRTEHVMVEIAY